MATKAVYRGISFPFRKSTTSYPAAVSDEDLIAESIMQIALTGRGERVMRGDFGSGVFAYVFENNDLILQEKIRADLTSSISRYEPRAVVRSVDAVREENEVIVTITYIVLSTQKENTVKVALPA